MNLKHQAITKQMALILCKSGYGKIAIIIQHIGSNKISTYRLTHDEMENEMNLMNANSAHGTNKAVQENTHNELRKTIKFNSPEMERWNKEYLV